MFMPSRIKGFPIEGKEGRRGRRSVKQRSEAKEKAFYSLNYSYTVQKVRRQDSRIIPRMFTYLSFLNSIQLVIVNEEHYLIQLCKFCTYNWAKAIL